jgi:TPR repeat protein
MTDDHESGSANRQTGMQKVIRLPLKEFSKTADDSEPAAETAEADQSETLDRYKDLYGISIFGEYWDELSGRFQWYLKSARQGNLDAQFMVGFLLFSGVTLNQTADGEEDFVRDRTSALYWYRKAAEQGHAEAQYNMGFVYENGECGLKADRAKAISWYRKAAAQGNPRADYMLSYLCAEKPHKTRQMKRRLALNKKTPRPGQ